jgi:Glycosyltransferase like family 2
MNYSIGIINFNKRFETCLMPLIHKIRSLDENIEIIVDINGNYKEQFDQQYRKNVLKFLSDFDFVYPIFFPNFKGCSKHWNSMLIHASNDNLLFLSDDVEIYDDNFLKAVDDLVNQKNETFCINGSCSHWVINRKQVDDIGWFDERLIGFGEEDGDFFYRYVEKYGKDVPNFNIGMVSDKGLQNGSDNIKKGVSKYTAFNRIFIFKKYVPSGNDQGIRVRYDEKHIRSNQYNDIQQYPYEKFIWEHSKEL